MSAWKRQRLAAIVSANTTARRKLMGWNQAAFAERLGIVTDLCDSQTSFQFVGTFSSMKKKFDNASMGKTLRRI